MTRVCHCVGHLTNPEGKCCKDLSETPTIKGTYAFTSTPLTEEDLRRIVREEIERAKPCGCTKS